ncbi:hypothetical protein LAZ67_20001149 [Cordylochernes scorpioides]|uniref:Secreted protein n=1 Tax=Cordylochernes scorpioides TaxID=51811 RepID=A0ABY6LM80_9ARAC|nr:hypothetical protein LAZ67_20001149 [Cordylochernes scorpioides]
MSLVSYCVLTTVANVSGDVLGSVWILALLSNTTEVHNRMMTERAESNRALRCQPLTPVHRQVRLQGCRERSTWTCANWGRIVFSDESCFFLCPDDRVWRIPLLRFHP